jgi:hypothetical protein
MENGQWQMVNGKKEKADVFTFSIFHFPFAMFMNLAHEQPTPGQLT